MSVELFEVQINLACGLNHLISFQIIDLAFVYLLLLTDTGWIFKSTFSPCKIIPEGPWILGIFLLLQLFTIWALMLKQDWCCMSPCKQQHQPNMQKCSLTENAIICNAFSSHRQFLLQSPVIWNKKPFLDVTAGLSSYKILSSVPGEKYTSRKR